MQQLLRRFKSGKLSEQKLIDSIHSIDLGFAQVDTHRAVRKRFPEVIFAEGKTAKQVTAIAQRLYETSGRVLITRVSDAQVRDLKRKFKKLNHHKEAHCVTLMQKVIRKQGGTIAVLCAGTSDVPVAEEAAVTAEAMGNRVERLFDVGVAGLHRLLNRVDLLEEAQVNIVVAGMEGALPSVVAGLTSKPVIAVPTSIGYGANFNGLAALLGMLNSCGSGVTVVNIDNGFGAGYAASQINALANPKAL